MQQYVYGLLREKGERRVVPRRHRDHRKRRAVLGVSTNDVLYGTLTPEYARAVTLDLGQKFFNVFVFCVGFEQMPFSISICAVQKPCAFLFVFLEPGYWHFRPDCVIVVAWTALKDFDFASSDFVLDSNLVPDMRWNLAPTVLSKELLDSLAFKFG